MKPFYAKIMDKMNEEQIAGWNVEDIFEAEEMVKRIFIEPSRFYIVLIKKEENKMSETFVGQGTYFKILSYEMENGKIEIRLYTKTNMSGNEYYNDCECLEEILGKKEFFAGSRMEAYGICKHIEEYLCEKYPSLTGTWDF